MRARGGALGPTIGEVGVACRRRGQLDFTAVEMHKTGMVLERSRLRPVERRRCRPFFVVGDEDRLGEKHLAAEFVSRFEFGRPGLPALSLATDTSMLTAIGLCIGRASTVAGKK